ncbi:MAG: AAA family ATPase [Pseudomonadota bacterium]
MIRRVAIDNYRCFTNFEYEPQRINLLLGANGAGKSSFFDLLAGLVDLVRQGVEIDDVLPTSSLTRWDARDQQRFELDVEGNGGLYRYVLVVKHNLEMERPVIESEKVTRDGKTLFCYENGTVHLHNNDGRVGVKFPFRGNMSFLAQIEERPETKDLMWLLEFLGGVWALRLNAMDMERDSQEEQASLARDGSNFASWYRHLSQESPELLQPLWESLRPVVPGFQSLKLSSAGARGRIRELVAVMAAADTPYEVEADELSDGQRALIVLYTLLQGVVPGEGCLMLDEPEAHVGLIEIQPWLVELDDRFEERGQIFVASHHPEVVDYLAASHPVVFERPGGGPARARPAVFDRDSGLTASKQIARGLTDGA